MVGRKRESLPEGEERRIEREEERERGKKKREKERDIWPLSFGGTMINGLAFSWGLHPQCSAWASPYKRVFQGEWTPQILLFVPDLAEPRPQRSDFNQAKPAKRKVLFNV